MRLFVATDPNALDKTRAVSVAPTAMICAQKAMYKIATQNLKLADVHDFKLSEVKLTRDFKTNSYRPPYDMVAAVGLATFEQNSCGKIIKRNCFPNPHITEVEATVVGSVLTSYMDDGLTFVKSKILPHGEELGKEGIEAASQALAHATVIEWCRTNGMIQCTIELRTLSYHANVRHYAVLVIAEDGTPYHRTLFVLHATDLIGA